MSEMVKQRKASLWGRDKQKPLLYRKTDRCQFYVGRGEAGEGLSLLFPDRDLAGREHEKWRKDREKVITRGRKPKSRSWTSRDPSLVPDPSTQTVHLPTAKCSSHHSSAQKLLEAHSGRRINSSSLLFLFLYNLSPPQPTPSLPQRNLPLHRKSVFVSTSLLVLMSLLLVGISLLSSYLGQLLLIMRTSS